MQPIYNDIISCYNNTRPFLTARRILCKRSIGLYAYSVIRSAHVTFGHYVETPEWIKLFIFARRPPFICLTEIRGYLQKWGCFSL